jgi:hypothetical protein
MHGHETALMVKIIGGQPEKVLVFRVVGQLPGGAVLTVRRRSADHFQVARDVARRPGRFDSALRAPAAAARAFEQLGGRRAPAVEPVQLRARP